MTLLPGSRIGHFEILSPLGTGGMGEVYRARDTRLGRIVAIKSLPSEFARDPDRLARFEQEAKLLATLNHPNIASIHGLEEVDGTQYLVLEFVGGETLGQRLARGPLSVRETLDVSIQVAAGLQAAHERDIVHRDLKPGNVMVTPAGTVKVLDFGIARIEREPNDADDSGIATRMMPRTEPGVVLGTTPYMSPEQARGEHLDRRTDVWAFGCVLFECLTSRPPFPGTSSYDVVAGILARDPDWDTFPAAAPSLLREVVRRCLVKNPGDRPRDIRDLRQELAAIAGTAGTGSAADMDDATRPSLAVLYFENLAADPDVEYFCAGVIEDILADLSKQRSLRVASRNAVARYRGATVDIRQAAAELGVTAVLEGSVRREGDRMRITAQLVNARDGFQLWAERYDKTLRDVFAVQEEIASSITAAMRVALAPGESKRILLDRPRDARAYDLYLRGRAEYARYAYAEAQRLFREAITIDPGYALAWAGLADCHAQFLQHGAKEPAEETRRGLEAVRRALELNPDLPDAHKAHALMLRFSGDLPGSRRALSRALEVDPRYGPAMGILSIDAYSSADVATAERLVRRVLEIDPQDALLTLHLGYHLWTTGRHDESLATIDHLRRLTSSANYITDGALLRALVHVSRGDPNAAERAVQAGREDGAAPLELRTVEALLSVLAGRGEEARAQLNEVENSTGVIAVGSVLAMASAYARLGDVESALRWADRPLVRHQFATTMRLLPELHPLLDRPPFAPRRREAVLVWPLEAPRVDAARQGLFQGVRIESAIPHGSELFGSFT